MTRASEVLLLVLLLPSRALCDSWFGTIREAPVLISTQPPMPVAVRRGGTVTIVAKGRTPLTCKLSPGTYRVFFPDPDPRYDCSPFNLHVDGRGKTQRFHRTLRRRPLGGLWIHLDPAAARLFIDGEEKPHRERSRYPAARGPFALDPGPHRVLARWSSPPRRKTTTVTVSSGKETWVRLSSPAPPTSRTCACPKEPSTAEGIAKIRKFMRSERTRRPRVAPSTSELGLVEKRRLLATPTTTQSFWQRWGDFGKWHKELEQRKIEHRYGRDAFDHLGVLSGVNLKKACKRLDTYLAELGRVDPALSPPRSTEW